MSQGLEAQGPGEGQDGEKHPATKQNQGGGEAERAGKQHRECCNCICCKACRALKALFGWRFNSQVVIAIFTVASAIGTGVSACYVRETLIQTQRAWISPSRIQTETALQTGQQGVIALSYTNVGKEPAINVGVTVKPFMVSNDEIKAPAVLADKIMHAMDGISCAKRGPDPNGFVVYPSGERDYKVSVDVNSGEVTRFLARDGYLVVAGCFTYETFGAPHYSAFCRYFEHRDGVHYSEWKSGICRVTEYAN